MSEELKRMIETWNEGIFDKSFTGYLINSLIEEIEIV